MYQPASTEPYGGVTSVRKRGQDESSSTGSPTGGQASLYPQSSGSSYTGAPHAAGYHHETAAPSPLSPPSQGRAGGAPTGHYKHNRATALVLLPPLLCLVLVHPTPYPLVALLFSALVLYSLDLANSRDGTALGVWAGFAVTSGTLLSGVFDDAGGGWGLVVTRTSCSVLLLFCVACWSTLQFQWLHKDTPAFAETMERMLHSVLPLASASVMTYHITSIVSNAVGLGVEVGATACPFVFLFFLVLGISFHGTAQSSFREAPASREAGDGAEKTKKKSDVPHAIAPRDGCILSIMLLVLPPVMHICTFRQRIMHSFASWDDGLDLILISTAPYVMHYILVLTESIWWAKSLPAIIRSGTTMTLLGAFIPILFSLISSVAFQLRYMLPVCASVSYMLNGHETQSAVLTTIYLTTSTLLILGGIWFYGRRDQNNELLYGEMHEDIFQGFLAIGGLLFGMALGMPWRLLPLPSLCFLAVAIYIATRMFRYFAVLLFVIFSASSFFIQYRFLYIQQNLDIFGMTMTLNRFGMVAVCVGLMIVSVVGLVFRASDGWGAEYLKKMDLTGIILSIYAFLMIPIEAALLKAFVEASAGDEDEVQVGGAYKPYMAFVSGTVVLFVSWHLKRTKCIKIGSAIVSASASVGKMLAVFVDIADDSTSDTVAAFLFRASVASMLLITMFAPYAILTPVHTKTRSKRTLGPSGKPVETLPGRTEMIVFCYCAIILPIVILISIPTVLKPVIGLLRGSALYYRSSPALSELIGFASSLWGVASLSMTNYLLPAGGADVWRKTSALMFFLGLGIFFAAPSLPWANDDVAPSSAFATVSSLGLGVSQSRSGGWGLVSASLATLLALTGPLELRERKDRSGLKDQSHLLRLMLFSIMFGCGASWFVVIQSMGDEPFLSLFMTATSCMATSFLGTVTCVLAYCLESQNFDEVQQMAKVWIGSSPIFLVVSGVSTISKNGSPPFGLGGWLSTYLFVCSLTALALALAVASRAEKTSATRGLGNLSCLTAWACATVCVYGQFGLAGIGVSSGSFLGVPVSVISTFAVAPILLLLEGESAESSRRTYNLSSSRQKVSTSFGINLKTLTRANRFAPPLTATVLVFLCAALYAILLRGCGWLAPSISGHDNVNSMQGKSRDVFSSVYGFLSKTAGGMKEQEDVASMAKKNLVQSKAVAAAAKLAGSGFWTSQNMFGPLLHLAGVVAVIPSLYCLVTYAWTGTKQSVAKIMALLPLNLFPLVLCRGIPSLWAVALVGLMGGAIQILLMRQSQWVSHMRM